METKIKVIGKKAINAFLEYVYNLEEVADNYGIGKNYNDEIADVFAHLRKLGGEK